MVLFCDMDLNVAMAQLLVCNMKIEKVNVMRCKQLHLLDFVDFVYLPLASNVIAEVAMLYLNLYPT